MTDIVKEMEDRFISDQKKEAPEMTSDTELIMRHSYTAGAVTFRELGRLEGDRSRRSKIIEALGIVEEGTEN